VFSISGSEFAAVAGQIDMADSFATEVGRIVGKEVDEKTESVDTSGEYNPPQSKAALPVDFDYEENDSNQLATQLNGYHRTQKQSGMNNGQLIGYSGSAKPIQELITTIGANVDSPSQSQLHASSEPEPMRVSPDSELRSGQDIERGRSRRPAPLQPPHIITEDWATFSSSINQEGCHGGNHTFDHSLLHPGWRPSHLANPPRITIEDCTPSPSVGQVAFHELYSWYNLEILHPHWQPQPHMALLAEQEGIEEPEIVISEEPEEFDSIDSINILRAIEEVSIEKSLLEWAKLVQVTVL
jgi:hypothetical protein